MNKKQLFLVSGGFLLLIIVFFFGNTIPPKKPTAPVIEGAASTQKETIHFEDLLAKAKQRLTPEQNERITRLENSVTRGDVKEQQLHIYHQLANFWKDTMRLFEPYAFYTSEAAKLENSEKSLTFAAHQFLNNLLVENNPAMQYWLASNAKVLLDKAIAINPNNDSTKIAIGACYMMGNISDNPMQGILPVREIAQKNPDNLYAQLILGLGGKRSGQFDRAIERFLIIVTKKPGDLEAMLHLAECYELKGDKPSAVKWYSEVKGKINNKDAQKELEDRINKLK